MMTGTWECCDQLFTLTQFSVCTDPWGGNAEIICDGCQERAHDREQERLMEDGPGPSLLEQQQAAWRLK